MAIVKCPNCGKMVSDTTKRCSECDGDLVITKYACSKCGSLNIELDKKGYKKQNRASGAAGYLLGLGLGSLLVKGISKKEYEQEIANGGGYFLCKDCGAYTRIRPDDKK